MIVFLAAAFIGSHAIPDFSEHQIPEEFDDDSSSTQLETTTTRKTPTSFRSLSYTRGGHMKDGEGWGGSQGSDVWHIKQTLPKVATTSASMAQESTLASVAASASYIRVKRKFNDLMQSSSKAVDDKTRIRQCIQTATAAIEVALNEFKDTQTKLDKLPSGEKCPQEGKAHLDRAKKRLKSPKNNLRLQRNK